MHLENGFPLLEVGQQPDGSVVIPEPLRPYVGTDRITKD